MPRARLLIPLILASTLLGLTPPLTPTASAGSPAPNKSVRKRAAPTTARYRVEIPAPTTRYVHVTLELDAAPKSTTELAMPAWTPGSYLIRDFGKHVYDVEATTLDGAPLTVTRVDKQTWTVANAGQPFRASYRVYAGDLSVRTSYLDDKFALLAGASLFVYVDGETRRAAELELALPTGWTSHTPLDPLPASQAGAAGRFTAPTYDELIDSPLLLGAAGQVQTRRFEVAGKPLELVFVAPTGSNADLDRIAGDAEQIVRAFARMLHGLPFDRYSFLLVGDAVGGGGLEHHDSTAMILPPHSFVGESGYARVQRLMAHEFFHLWNVKRIHDVALGPFDYTQETYSNLLWFHEGLTETMETRAMLRSGLISADDYLRELGHAWTGYRRKPGRNAAAITELSREAWIKAYKPEPNHGETTISYYEKGNLIGVCLDLELRLRSAKHGGAGSVEGLFRRLWAGRDPYTGQAAITLADIVAAASAEAGEDMQPFFDRYVLGTEELPLPELLAQAGFEVEVEALAGGEDGDGVVPGWSGMSGRGPELTAIEPGSPAAAAGLMLGDELIAVAGARVASVGEANERLAELGVGQAAELTLFRRDRLETRTLTTAANPHRGWTFAQPSKPGDQGLARLRELWLLEHLVK